MPMYQIGGDAAKVADLAADQATHQTRFETIKGQIVANAAQVLGAWDGAGQPDHDTIMKKYGDEFQRMQDGLTKMRNATDDAAGQLTTLTGQVQSMMSA